MSDLRVRRLDKAHQSPEVLGRLVHDRLNEDGNITMLRNRHLPGVIANYTQHPSVAVESMERAARASRTSVGEHAGFTAFVAYDESGVFVGMGTIISGLHLYRQRMALPPKLVRPFEKPLEISNGRPNIAAWVVEQAYSFTNQPLRAMYEQLLGHTGGCGWTLNPVGNEHSLTTQADLLEAGFRVVGEGRYDDMVSGKIVPPNSQLMVAG